MLSVSVCPSGTTTLTLSLKVNHVFGQFFGDHKMRRNLAGQTRILTTRGTAAMPNDRQELHRPGFHGLDRRRHVAAPRSKRPRAYVVAMYQRIQDVYNHRIWIQIGFNALRRPSRIRVDSRYSKRWRRLRMNLRADASLSGFQSHRQRSRII